jgi:hypothetical protein
MTRKDGKALCECPEHGLYQTSISVSKNFRAFCKKLGSKPNRSQGYYTSIELKVKRILDSLGLREGIDYVHNCRIKNGKRYYWLDFYLPLFKSVIRVNPKIWHSMWNRGSSDLDQKKFLLSNNLEVFDIDEKSKIEDIISLIKLLQEKYKIN